MPDTPLTVLFVDLPPQLREMIQQELEAGSGVTSLTTEADELERTVERVRPDAVVVPLERGRPLPESRRLLEERARLRVLGVGTRDGHSVLYELCPTRSELGAVKPNEMAAKIRQAISQQVSV